MVAVAIPSLLSLTVTSLTHRSSVGLRENLFSFSLTSAGSFLLAFLDSISPLNTATDCAFDLDFPCINMFTLCESPWTLSSPRATLLKSEIGREGERAHSLDPVSSPVLIPPKSFPATFNLPEESYKLQMHSWGIGLGQEEENDPSL